MPKKYRFDYGTLKVINPSGDAAKCVVTLFTLLLCTASMHAQTVRYVDSFHQNSQDGANTCTIPSIPCETIGHAIGVSVSGDSITIGPAIYTEMLEIDKSLTLQGAGEGNTIIQAHEEPGEADGRVITIDGPFEVTIAGVTIRHGNAIEPGFPTDQGGGIYTRAGAITLIDVTFSENIADRAGGGIFINYNLAPPNRSTVLTNVTFINNRTLDDLGGSGGGLYVFSTGFTSLTNVTFSGNESGRYGGGMVINGNDPILTNVTFNGNRADLHGGGIYNVFGSPTLNNVTFHQNTATRQQGGGMYSHGGAPELTGVTFENNAASDHGGGMYVTGTGALTMNDVLFDNNRTHPAGISNHGGGMYITDGSTATLNDVTFTGNSAGGSGGGIYSIDADSLFLRDVTLEENTAGGAGGGMYNRKTFLEADFVTISRNTAAQSGGGIYNVQSTTILTNVSFIGNKSLGPSHTAGGLFDASDRPNPTSITNVTFEENEATSGAGMFDPAGNITYTDVTFIGNIAANAGGGLASFAVNPSSLSGVSFERNTARMGGGMYVAFDSLTLTDVTFIGNIADTLGGGIYNSGAAFELIGVTFSENEAGWAGGGMHNRGGRAQPVLIDVTFNENTAGFFGGGMYNELSANPKLTGVTFRDNSAEDSGGGMYNHDNSTPVIRNTVFERNYANYGGGIFNNSSSPSLIGIKFIGNTAHLRGGGMENSNSTDALLTNVSFSGNTAQISGGGISNVENGAVSLFNSIVWGNTAGEIGNEIFNDTGGSIKLHYSLYSNGEGDIVEGGGWSQDTHSLTLDPLFVDAENGDLRLRAGSPAIETGDPNTEIGLFPVNGEGFPIDIGGSPRMIGDRIDMGAYEFQGLESPQLVSPADAAVDIDLPVTLEWDSVPGAERYHLQLAHAGESFDDPVLDEEELQDNEFTVSDLEAITEYQWRIRAITGVIESSWSETRKFTTTTVTGIDVTEGVPTEPALYQNYPNPFNPSTTIQYDLPSESHVQLEVYNLLGQRVAVLVDELREPGYHVVQFEAGNLSNGMYIYRIRAGEYMEVRKLMLLR
jgi:predicted outer membrane repeat protein